MGRRRNDAIGKTTIEITRPFTKKEPAKFDGFLLRSRYASWSYSASCSSAGFSAFFSRFLAGFSSTWTDSSTSIS